MLAGYMLLVRCALRRVNPQHAMCWAERGVVLPFALPTADRYPCNVLQHFLLLLWGGVWWCGGGVHLYYMRLV